MQREALETIRRIEMRIDEPALSGIHSIPIVDDPKLIVKAEVSIGDRHIDSDPALVADFRVIKLIRLSGIVILWGGPQARSGQ